MCGRRAERSRGDAERHGCCVWMAGAGTPRSVEKLTTPPNDEYMAMGMYKYGSLEIASKVRSNVL
jgi:hypothetical protein